MTVYTIDGFWKVRLPQAELQDLSEIAGWSIVNKGLPTFKEAPLTLSVDLTPDGDPVTSPLILVSAPGAVGKSTLAREVAFNTGAVYIDLAAADPVGGNTIIGGLVKSGLYEKWKAGAVTLLVDGLDEARLRVTQEGFEAFLADVVALAKDGNSPTVLFGRTGAIQDAWLLMADMIPLAILEIGYYGPEASLEFAEARVRKLRNDNKHTDVDRQAVELLLERLRKETEIDGDRFAGYAPVLQAVANRVAAEGNPSALIAQIKGGAQPVTLQSVVTSILERERDKLSPLPFEDQTLADKLYLPEEQLDRLVARTYTLPPPDLPAMGPLDAQTYSTALEQWVGEHPFLKGGQEPSSAVFDAIISAHALRTANSAEAATQRELRRGTAANPFLAEFYLPPDASAGDTHVPPEHIGVVYASLRARLSLGESASLLVEGVEDATEEDTLRAVVEISFDRRNADRPRTLQFETDQTGSLRLGALVEDVELSVPHARVEIGPGPEALIVAPVSIQCDILNITADKIIAECAQGRKAASVFLEAASFEGPHITSVPMLRGDASLLVSWPGAHSHPWTSFATEPTPIDDPRLEEAARRLRRLVTAFRSHSKGNLARYKDKIEHARMTKGSGKDVLALLVSEKVLSLNGNMYYLDPVLLAKRVGTTYAECTARRFGPQTLDFLKQALTGAS